MRTTLNIDDDLLLAAEQVTGVSEKNGIGESWLESSNRKRECATAR